MNILIVGAGKLGVKLAHYFKMKNNSVWGWKRSKVIDNNLDFINFDSVDVSKNITIEPSVSLDLVFYMVAPSLYDEKSYNNSYYLGVKNTISWLEKNQLNPKFIFISSTGVYGQKKGEDVDENSEVSSESISGKYLLKGEEEVYKSNLDSCSVRFGGIYDESRLGAFYGCYFKSFSKQQEKCYLNLIHSEDCVGVLFFSF